MTSDELFSSSLVTRAAGNAFLVFSVIPGRKILAFFRGISGTQPRKDGSSPKSVTAQGAAREAGERSKPAPAISRFRKGFSLRQNAVDAAPPRCAQTANAVGLTLSPASRALEFPRFSTNRRRIIPPPVERPKPASSGLPRRVNRPAVYGWYEEQPDSQARFNGLLVQRLQPPPHAEPRNTEKRLKPLSEKAVGNGLPRILRPDPRRKRRVYQPPQSGGKPAGSGLRSFTAVCMSQRAPKCKNPRARFSGLPAATARNASRFVNNSGIVRPTGPPAASTPNLDTRATRA